MNAPHGLPDLDEVRNTLISFARRTGTENVELAEARSRILARAIRADRDLPPFDRATMDGIAVRWSELDADARFRIVRTVAAGQPPGPTPEPGCGVRIATGAALPDGLDVVVKREVVGATDRADTVEVTDDGFHRWDSVHRRGIDARAGDELVPPDTAVDPTVIAIAATTGRSSVEVRRRPRCTIITTGDELREVDDTLDGADDRFRIRDGNGPMLAAAMRAFGADVVAVSRAADTLATTRTSIEKALADTDLCITVGGVSAGDLDFVPGAAKEIGLDVAGRGVRLQPGRPFSWWTKDGDLRLAGLPGNPVSALVCAHVFIRPWVESSLGIDPDAAWTMRRLQSTTSPNPHRDACRPARFGLDSKGRATVAVAGWNGSGDLPHLIGTDGIVRLPQGTAPIEAGHPLPSLPWAATSTDIGLAGPTPGQ
ncbi:MAG: molybdopterin molybdotransferase MoeA [Phycisphaera sp.]|nr:molybdopterin molybdotransferase MoeA [Phycisphaera sp.]